MSAHSAARTQSGAGVQRTRKREESEIQAGILAALGLEPDLRLFRNNVGLAQYASGAKVRYGLCNGSGDLIGILAPTGRLVSLEVKSSHGVPTPDQIRWAIMVRRMGGFACIVRSVAEARDAVARARKGASE